MSRDERQDIALQKWIDAGSIGSVVASTGFGKTRIALNAIKLLRRNDRTRTVIVVVPTLQLKEQWESILRDADQLEHSRVYVINTLIKLRQIKCSLLVLDEIHRYAADTFKMVFNVVQYSFILGLTATIKRLDEKHVLLVAKAPVVDTVSIQECKANGWIAEFREYNLGIEMTDEEKEKYADLKSKFQAMFSKFNNDFDLMKNCSFSCKPVYNDGVVSVPTVVRLAMRLGWRGNTPERAYRNMQENANRSRGERISVWGGDGHPYHPEILNIHALNGMRYMRQMKEFVHKAPSKVDAAIKIINAFDCKTITFAELIETADLIKDYLGDSCVVYHSQVKAAVIDGKKIPGTRMKLAALEKIKNDPATKVIATAKALDQGFDYPGAELGIILSRTSNPTQRIQRIGRVARKHTFEDGRVKKGVIVNIYIKDTKDHNWLMASQKGQRGIGIYEVDSVDEIIEAECESEPVGVENNL